MGRQGFYTLSAVIAIISLFGIILGGFIISIGLFPLPTTSVSGQVVSAKMISGHLRVSLSGDDRLFDIAPADLHPTPPAALPVSTHVTVWVKQGKDYVLALQVTDSATGASQKFTTTSYDDPEGTNRQNITGGVISILAGFAVAIVGGVVLILVARVSHRFRPRSRYTPTYMPDGVPPAQPQPGEIEYPPRY